MQENFAEAVRIISDAVVRSLQPRNALAETITRFRPRPCPFCGETTRVGASIRGVATEKPAYWVNCGGCGATGPTAGTLPDAERGWGAREDAVRAG